MDHLQDLLEAARAAILNDAGTVIIRATQLDPDALPASGEYVMLDVVPGAPTNLMDGSLYEDLNLQVGAWSDTNLASALTLAENARKNLSDIDYQRTSGVQLLREDGFAGVLATYTLTAGFDDIT